MLPAVAATVLPFFKKRYRSGIIQILKLCVYVIICIHLISVVFFLLVIKGHYTFINLLNASQKKFVIERLLFDKYMSLRPSICFSFVCVYKTVMDHELCLYPKLYYNNLNPQKRQFVLLSSNVTSLQINLCFEYVIHLLTNEKSTGLGTLVALKSL